MDKKDIPVTNYFGDMVTAHIDAMYKNGKFYKYGTEELVTLDPSPLDQVYVQMIVPLHSIPKEEFENHAKSESNLILHAGSTLDFDLPTRSKLYKITIEIQEDLVATRRGNKKNRLYNCHCKVIGTEPEELIKTIQTKNKLEYDSLNQCFTHLSILLRPENRSHTCNVFKTFRFENHLLEDIRNRDIE